MESKSIELRSPFRIDQSIYLLGDVHIGSANFARPEFVKSVNMIKESGGYWIGMGDYVDCITTRDPRFNPFEIAQEFGVRDLANLPMAQANEFMKLIEPIKDKCLGLISGNHEDKYRQHNGTDITDYICQTIGATNLRQKAWINLPNTLRPVVNQALRVSSCHRTIHQFQNQFQEIFTTCGCSKFQMLVQLKPFIEIISMVSQKNNSKGYIKQSRQSQETF